MTKQQIVSRVTEQLSQQLATMTVAARAAHEASTGDEAKAEGKYDTRGLEASYLADAQAEQCQQLARHVHVYESLVLEEFSPGSAVDSGAMVETEQDGDITYYLLTPCAGGIMIEYEGLDLTTLSPESPLYQELLGKSCGDIIDSTGMLILEIS